ncbi:MAG: response regulator transcription factor [bacterium]
MEKVIAVVDDEEDIVELISINLQKAGYKVKGFGDGKALFKSIAKSPPDMILLDLMLPGMDGIEICRELKRDNKYAAIPVIMLTAKGDVTDKVLGLEMGADDFITKPFSLKELAARVKAVLRRNETKALSSKKEIGRKIEMDEQKFEVTVKGKKIELTATEFKILQILSEKPGWVFSREQMLDKLWGNEKIVIDRTIDVHIRHLREKLGTAASIIKNIRGVGYKLEE